MSPGDVVALKDTWPFIALWDSPIVLGESGNVVNVFTGHSHVFLVVHTVDRSAFVLAPGPLLGWLVLSKVRMVSSVEG